jgi:hypothetical protein
MAQEWRTLIDLNVLSLVPKRVRPLDEQHDKESRRMWDPVTKEILAKNWGEATRQKQIIEQVGAVVREGWEEGKRRVN